MALREHVAATGGVAGFSESEPIDPDELLLQECEILIPAALERVIDSENAGKLKCKVLAEGANGPTTPEADAILEERGDVFLVPDILCNAGGVTVSYFEWVQNLQRESWSSPRGRIGLGSSGSGAGKRHTWTLSLIWFLRIRKTLQRLFLRKLKRGTKSFAHTLWASNIEKSLSKTAARSTLSARRSKIS